ncbi:cupin domain-containing protein [Burkholderia lata]|uniref:cupin domain-containing protein n=1 Tax=Burkholderia lata (strain ATCC 17760 / DSM 23089 / LMG 22485 / NCIMB 9086 / R18194 / 383) TaxID=482957 RepID=UPI0020C67EF8|nr:cupin domain-containing protein [Burkholderia lata]
MSNHKACCNLLDVVVDLDRQSGLGGGTRYDRCPEAGRTARGFLVPAYASRSSDFETVPRERLGAGITRQTIRNANSTIAKWVFAKNAVIPLHHHLNEQITWITAGSVKAFSQGKHFRVSAGQVIVFPANVPHESRALEDGTVDIDIFTPARPTTSSRMPEITDARWRRRRPRRSGVRRRRAISIGWRR